MYRRNDDGSFYFFNQAKAGRQYTQSSDDITSFDADLGIPVLDRTSWKLTLHGGASYYTQERLSATRRFSFELKDETNLTQAPENLFNTERLGSTLVVKDQTQTNDTYLGDAAVQGFYLKADNDWFERVRLTFGARQESAEYNVKTFVAGGSQGGKAVQAGFEDADILPFGALTWRFVDTMQARVSAARTVSRPVLNELSPARYYDPESGEEYLGNPKLRPAVIDALDVRWEWYPTGRESISAGVFTKNYTDPIEQSFVGVGGSSYLRQVQNAAGAKVQGLELSARADFTRFVEPIGAAGDWSDRAYLQANVAFVESEVELARKDLATSLQRPLQGQANNIYNLQVGYDGDRHDADLSYNRVGRRLFLAGVQGQPDVYQQPFGLLDVNYSFGFTEQLKLKAKLGNLLDPRFEFLQGAELYRAYRKGIDASLGFSFTL
jgi:TonB-dependent receptor